MKEVRWSIDSIHEWHNRKGWLLGCNYAPSTAVNQLEMWEADSFDPITIRRELDWARDLGFNSIRVFLHHLLWEHDPDGILRRMDQFLSIARERGLGVMFVLFDAVWNPFPEPGKRDHRTGVHNSGWLQSPGVEILTDLSRHDELKSYVQGIVGRFANDDRVDVWDLFNEPCNRNQTSYGAFEPVNKEEFSLALLKKVFAWVREVNPAQPLTAGVWVGEWTPDRIKELDAFMLENSDVITFHNYESPDEMERRIQQLRRFGRPILCTEYMARSFNNTFESILPIFLRYNVGGYNWGLVAGKTQTNYAWDSWTVSYDGAPDVWFHDIFYPDGTPYRMEEVEYLSRLTKPDRSR